MKEVVVVLLSLFSACGLPAMVPPTGAVSESMDKMNLETVNACVDSISVCHSKSCLFECRQLLVIAQDDPENLFVYINGRLQDRNTYTLGDSLLTFVGPTCNRMKQGAAQAIDVVQGCSGVSPKPELKTEHVEVFQ